MKKYKALITDVDGTLIENGRNTVPSKKVTEAVKKASKVVHIGLATSRSLDMLDDIFEPLNLSGPSIISGGAQIIDAKTKLILWRKNINKDDFIQAIKLIKSFNLPCFVQGEQNENVVEIAIVNLEEKVGRELRSRLKVISDLGVHLVPDWEKGRVGVIITHAEATKQYGIFKLAKMLKIDTKEMIGVGDGYNDFPLLMACGLKVAMGDAPDDLKAIADFIAPTAKEDGLVEVINRFVL